MAPACPLCAATDSRPIDCDGRLYFRCGQCAMVFLDPALRLGPEAEHSYYDLHDNDPADPRYRAFLSRTLAQVTQRFEPPARGLDFGCGPGPALTAMAGEAGFPMDAYDAFYRDDRAVFTRRYDFITCTEVAEHLFSPRAELDRLWGMLAHGGALIIQTQRVLNDTRFRAWNYRRDPTHVVFFSDSSFAWLARRWNARLTLPHADVAVLEKSTAKV